MDIFRYILVGMVLTECAWFDIKTRAVPGHAIIAAIMTIYASLLIWGKTDDIITSVIGLAALVIPSVIYSRSFNMGEGDILMLAMVGATIGINHVMVFLVTADICMLLFLLYTRKDADEMPMAPFFLIGYIAAVLSLVF